MIIRTEKTDDRLTVMPEGRLDSNTNVELEEFLAKNFTPDVPNLTLDMSGVDYISSKGIRILVTVYKALEGRTMEIVRCNESVTEVLRLSGLLKILNVRD